MASFKLGQRVIAKARIIPLKKRNYGTKREWERIELPRPKRGIVAGVRYVQEGRTEYVDEGFPIFCPKKWIKAVLIATALNATLLALPEDVEAKEAERDA